MMGSGGMVVLDEDDCMVEVAPVFSRLHSEGVLWKVHPVPSGNKANVGHPRRYHEGQRENGGPSNARRFGRGYQTGITLRPGENGTQSCAHTLRYFRDEYEAHIKEGRCPAKMCQTLIAYYILPEKCARGCDACVGTCTVEAISTDKKRRIKVIDQEKCVKCNTCLVACPPQYDAVIRLSPPESGSKGGLHPDPHPPPSRGRESVEQFALKLPLPWRLPARSPALRDEDRGKG